MAAKPSTESAPGKDDGEKSPDASAAPQPAGFKSVLLSSVVTGLALGAVGFALAYFVVPARLLAAPAHTPVATAPAPAAPAPAVKEATARSAAEIAASGGKAVTKFTIEEVTVNIADTRGNRFVRAGVFFEADPPVLEELEANRPRMIDTVGQVLSTKTLDELTAPDIRGNLRQQLMGIINPTLKQGKIDNLYFTDLLVQ